MPIYEYSCPQCGHEFEDLKSVRERNRTLCPQCAAVVSRKVSLASVRPDPFSWHHENNGRGRYIEQLQRTHGSKKDPKAYCKNRDEISTKAERLGCSVDKSVY